MGESDYDQSLFTLIFAVCFYLNGIEPILSKLASSLNFEEKQNTMGVAGIIKGMTCSERL